MGRILLPSNYQDKSPKIILMKNDRSTLFVEFLSNAMALETVQDFLIKLDIKPLTHLVEISIFSLNNDLVKLTKIMNNLVKDLKIPSVNHF